MTHATDDLVGTSEAAAIIGVERSTLVRWVQMGRRIAPAMRLQGKNGAYLFHRVEVERTAQTWATENAAVAGPTPGTAA